jgi:hypothetical protein
MANEPDLDQIEALLEAKAKSSNVCQTFAILFLVLNFFMLRSSRSRRMARLQRTRTTRALKIQKILLIRHRKTPRRRRRSVGARAARPRGHLAGVRGLLASRHPALVPSHRRRLGVAARGENGNGNGTVSESASESGRESVANESASATNASRGRLHGVELRLHLLKKVSYLGVLLVCLPHLRSAGLHTELAQMTRSATFVLSSPPTCLSRPRRSNCASSLVRLARCPRYDLI